jgi:uncharacterized membrane protein
MADQDLRGIATTAKIAGHPLHPMLIPFPITLLTAASICDLTYWYSGDGFWAQVSFWSLGAALVTGMIAAAAGFTDFFGNARIRAISHAWHHMIGNIVVMLLALANFWLRYDQGAEAGLLPWGLVLSLATTVVLLYTGWKGGELAYGHRIGMQPEAPSPARMPRDIRSSDRS